MRLLKNSLEELSGVAIQVLPFPYEYREPVTAKLPNTCQTIAFLGDGRYEKGLLYLLQDIATRKSYKYYIQNLNPRGYGMKDWTYFEKSIENLKNKSHVQLYKKPFFPDAFVRMLSKFDLVILPYLPESYDKRGSGIYVQAAQHAIPVVVAAQTWMADEVKQNGNGVVFSYTKSRNLRENSLKLSNAIDIAIKGYRVIKTNALEAQQRYLREYSAESFLDVITETKYI